jgi:hypothetical protein
MNASSTIQTLTLPAVECAAWCADGNGHVRATSPEDQWCASEARLIALSAMPLSVYNGKVVGRQTIEARIERDYNARTSRIHTSLNEGTPVIYTPAEALEHARHLTELAMVALATDV